MTTPAAPGSRNRFGETGRLIVANGHKEWVRVEGSGTPVVVFEPAIGDVGLTWGLVQPLVAKTTTTFTHDRPGLGNSDPVGSRRDLDTMVAELGSTLGASELAPPYLLVGHSFASLIVRAFTALYPDQVMGLVLVDGAHEDQMERFPDELDPSAMLAGLPEQLRAFADAARRGEPVPELSLVPEAFSAELAAEYREATRPAPTRLETVADEFESLAAHQERMRQLADSWPSTIPLIALRHGMPQPMPGVADEVNERYETAWVDLQEELAARSSRGEVRVASGAGHMIHHDRPDLVVAAIADLAGSP